MRTNLKSPTQKWKLAYFRCYLLKFSFLIPFSKHSSSVIADQLRHLTMLSGVSSTKLSPSEALLLASSTLFAYHRRAFVARRTLFTIVLSKSQISGALLADVRALPRSRSPFHNRRVLDRRQHSSLAHIFPQVLEWGAIPRLSSEPDSARILTSKTQLATHMRQHSNGPPPQSLLLVTICMITQHSDSVVTRDYNLVLMISIYNLSC